MNSTGMNTAILKKPFMTQTNQCGTLSLNTVFFCIKTNKKLLADVNISLCIVHLVRNHLILKYSFGLCPQGSVATSVQE